MSKTILLSLAAAMVASLMSGCVWQSDFDKFVAESNRVNRVLLCESRLDAYQDLLGSDEMDPTRRDEMDPTRRDLQSCLDEFDDVSNSNAPACQIKGAKCRATGLSGTACRTCLLDCLNTGTWDDVACPVP